MSLMRCFWLSLARPNPMAYTLTGWVPLGLPLTSQRKVTTFHVPPLVQVWCRVVAANTGFPQHDSSPSVSRMTLYCRHASLGSENIWPLVNGPPPGPTELPLVVSQSRMESSELASGVPTSARISGSGLGPLNG